MEDEVACAVEGMETRARSIAIEKLPFLDFPGFSGVFRFHHEEQAVDAYRPLESGCFCPSNVFPAIIIEESSNEGLWRALALLV